MLFSISGQVRAAKIIAGSVNTLGGIMREQGAKSDRNVNRVLEVHQDLKKKKEEREREEHPGQ